MLPYNITHSAGLVLELARHEASGRRAGGRGLVQHARAHSTQKAVTYRIHVLVRQAQHSFSRGRCPPRCASRWCLCRRVRRPLRACRTAVGQGSPSSLFRRHRSNAINSRVSARQALSVAVSFSSPCFSARGSRNGATDTGWLGLHDLQASRVQRGMRMKCFHCAHMHSIAMAAFAADGHS